MLSTLPVLRQATDPTLGKGNAPPLAARGTVSAVLPPPLVLAGLSVRCGRRPHGRDHHRRRALLGRVCPQRLGARRP